VQRAKGKEVLPVPAILPPAFSLQSHCKIRLFKDHGPPRVPCLRPRTLLPRLLWPHLEVSALVQASRRLVDAQSQRCHQRGLQRIQSHIHRRLFRRCLHHRHLWKILWYVIIIFKANRCIDEHRFILFTLI
jgi:hypothetical protein